MTKQEEIDSLKTYTASLPKDSYLRPWLEDVLPQVETDIRNDFPVSPSLVETRRWCREREAEAQRQANSIISKAVRETAELQENDRKDRMNCRNHLAEELRAILSKLGYGH